MANPSPDKGNASEHADFSDETIRHRFFRDLIESERLAVFKAFGVYPPGCTNRLDHSIERRLLNRILRRATPPSPSTAPEVDEHAAFEVWAREQPAVSLSLLPESVEGMGVYRSGHTQWLYDGWQARSALASRPCIKLDPELKAALEEAAKTGATSALLPGGGAVFINRGHDYGDNANLECTACGGSGHIDDQRKIALASRPAEVDDEGLPPLPEPKYCADDLTDIFTAEQFRQGQRDAVAADRARRGAAGK